MEYYWQIETQNCHFETRYLQSVHPSFWCILPKNAKRFNDHEVLKACQWLVKLGISFSLKRYDCV